jgi:hypothetical protein
MEYHIGLDGKHWKVYKTKRGLMNYMKKQTGMYITTIKRSTFSGDYFINMTNINSPSTPGYQNASRIEGLFIYQGHAYLGKE